METIKEIVEMKNKGAAWEGIRKYTGVSVPTSRNDDSHQRRH